MPPALRARISKSQGRISLEAGSPTSPSGADELPRSPGVEATQNAGLGPNLGLIQRRQSCVMSCPGKKLSP